jgi:phosphoribosylaminoimidazole (AIR) synthetase
VTPEEVDKALEILTASGDTAYVIGRIVASDEKITIV